VTGKVVWWNAMKGYGWIAPDHEPDHQVFVHLFDLPGRVPPAIGDHFQYEEQITPKGVQAVRCEVLERSPRAVGVAPEI
jgi:cold shock CspA family protein